MPMPFGHRYLSASWGTIVLKTKVLFIVNYFTSGNVTNKLSNELANSYISITENPHLDVRFFCYDAGIANAHGQDVLTTPHGKIDDMDILNFCLNPLTRPQVILYLESIPGVITPDYVTIACIRRTLGIPIIMLWHDTEGDDIIRMEQMYPFVDKHVLHDGFDPARFTRTPNRYIRDFPPQDTRLLYDDERERDITVSLAGNIKSQGRRREYIQALEKAGIPVCVMGGRGWQDGDDDVPTQELFDLYRRSQITLNFVGRPGTHTGRLLEATLCGALLMEPEHSWHSPPFIDFIDLVPFSNEQELIDRVRYFLDHKDEARRIALNGKKKAIEQCSNYWDKLLLQVLSHG